MSDEVVPSRVYYRIFTLLIVLTAVTVGVGFADLGRLNTVIALTIATVKAVLVMLYFMELRFSSRLVWLVTTVGFVWLGVLIVFTMTDVLSRGWLGFPGK